MLGIGDQPYDELKPELKDSLPAAVEVQIGVVGGEVGHIVHGGVLVDHPYMDLYRSRKAVICCGQGAWEQPDTTRQLKQIFEQKGIPVWVDLWGYDAAEGQTTIEKIGEPQVEVDGMGRAQAAAKGDHAGEAVPAVALLGDYMDEVV